MNSRYEEPVQTQPTHDSAGPDPRTLLSHVRIKAHALGSLIRPPFALLVLMFAQLGAEQTGKPLPFGRSALLFTAILGWILAVVAMNELGDEDVDRHNLDRQDQRPLVNSDLTRWEMRMVVTVGAATSVGAAISFGSWAATAVVLAGLALGAAYSLPPLRLSRRGPATSLLLPLGYVAVPFLTGTFAAIDGATPAPVDTTATGPGVSTWLLLVGLYLSFLGRLLLKDFRDLQGDMLYGKRTFLVRFGRVTTVAVSSAFWILGGVPIVLAGESSELAVAYGLSAVSALWLLNRLASSVDERADDILIAAIAAIGRSVLLATICLYATRNTTGPIWLTPTMVAGSTAMGLLAQWRYLGYMTAEQRVRLTGAARRDHIRYATTTRSADPATGAAL